jgi:cytoskeletal protein RodZ
VPAWFERSIVAAGLTVAALLVVVNVVAWRDYRRDNPALQENPQGLAASENREVQPLSAATATTRATTTTQPQTTRPFAGSIGGPPSPSTKPTLVVHAARGDSWLEARMGSENGSIRYRGTLLEGKEVRLSGARLWLRIGAGENLDVLLNGKAAEEVPAGTATVVVTSRGLQTIGVG